jgi:hypothetical protein
MTVAAVAVAALNVDNIPVAVTAAILANIAAFFTHIAARGGCVV